MLSTHSSPVNLGVMETVNLQSSCRCIVDAQVGCTRTSGVPVLPAAAAAASPAACASLQSVLSGLPECSPGPAPASELAHMHNHLKECTLPACDDVYATRSTCQVAFDVHILLRCASQDHREIFEADVPEDPEQCGIGLALAHRQPCVHCRPQSAPPADAPPPTSSSSDPHPPLQHDDTKAKKSMTDLNAEPSSCFKHLSSYLGFRLESPRGDLW